MGCGASTKYKALYAENETHVSAKSLASAPLLQTLPKDELAKLANAFVGPQVFQKGDAVFSQGDPGQEFYIIRSGRALVTLRGDDGTTKTLRTLEEGDFFGEKALIRDELRTATVTADTLLTTLKLTQQKFHQLGLHEKVSFSRRKPIGKDRSASKSKPAMIKTPEQRQFIAKALKDNANLQVMVPLDDERINAMIDICWQESVKCGDTVIEQGDVQADFFYVIQDGSFEVLVAAEHKRRKHGRDANGAKRTKMREIGAGSSFGEMALLVLSPRSATVNALADSTLWVFDRDNFKDILLRASASKIAKWTKTLDQVEILQSLTRDDKLGLAQGMMEMHFAKDELIFEEGMPAVSFFILIQGGVSVICKKKEVRTLLVNSQEGETATFGEKALLDNEPRTATIKVVSDVAKLLVIDREAFTALLGPLSDIMKRNGYVTPAPTVKAKGIDWEPAEIERLETQEHSVADQEPDEMDVHKLVCRKVNTKPKTALKKQKKSGLSLSNLKKIGVLGCGAFGVVEMYADKKSGDGYAIKSLCKGYVKSKKMLVDVMNEKEIMMKVESPFIIKLYGTYSSPDRLHFVLELAIGGELYATYERKGLHGNPDCARFYIAGVVCALNHLHVMHVIYRDIKPENLMLDQAGQLKLCDFGLAKLCVGMTYTMCGTPDYFAPEVIMSMGYNIAVDWWAVGVLLFELMSGNPPFEAEDESKASTYAMIMNGIDAVDFPKPCLGAIQTLIKGLLTTDPATRLPMRSGGVKNIKDHKWYAGFDWDSFESLKMEAPFIPQVLHKLDLRNFCPDEEDMPDRVPYKDDGSGWGKDFATME